MAWPVLVMGVLAVLITGCGLQSGERTAGNPPPPTPDSAPDGGVEAAEGPTVEPHTPERRPTPTPTAESQPPASPDASPEPQPESPDQDKEPVPDPEPPPSRYVFPIAPPEDASYSHDHHTYPATDLFASCGSPVVAVTDSVVDELNRTDTWDPQTDDPATRGGLFLSLVGHDGVRYYMSHFGSLEDHLQVGDRVEAGERVGTVGRSGNARHTPCHIHFGLSPPRGPGDWQVRRGVIWPWPYLDAWRAGEHLSPTAEIAKWEQPNP